MEMKAVSSSAISAIGYDPESKTLRVQFTGTPRAPGKAFDYPDVPQNVAHHFINSPVEGSHGKHFAQHIKKYSAVKA